MSSATSSRPPPPSVRAPIPRRCAAACAWSTSLARDSSPWRVPKLGHIHPWPHLAMFNSASRFAVAETHVASVHTCSFRPHTLRRHT